MNCIYLTKKSKRELIKKFQQIINKITIRGQNELVFIEKKNKVVSKINELDIFPTVLLRIIRQYIDKTYFIKYDLDFTDLYMEGSNIRGSFNQYDMCLIMFPGYIGELNIYFINSECGNNKENFILSSEHIISDNVITYFNKYMAKNYNKKKYFKNMFQFAAEQNMNGRIPNKILKRIIIITKLIVDAIQYADFDL